MTEKHFVSSILNTSKEWVSPFTDLWFFKGPVAFTIGMLGFAFGTQFFYLVGVLIWLVVIDSITGVWGAKACNEVISSKRFIATVPKMIRYLIFVTAAHALQMTIGVNLYIENVVITFLAATEFISITENLGKMGMPMPKKLLNTIEELRNGQ